MKKTAKFLSLLLLGALCLENAVAAITFSGTDKNPTETKLYPGVVHTHIKTTPKTSSTYGMANINVLEVDLSNPNLHFEVVPGGEKANQLATVAKTCENYNKQNNGKTALAAVNGDLWMVAYAHARYDMSKVTGTYKNYPLVCKKPMTLPRGFNMYDGEIITTPHMAQEEPFEGPFQSFGITEDGKLIMGQPRATVTIYNQKSLTVGKVDGVNRLPADNALVLYTDIALTSNNYSLDDAYEVLVETSGDYKLSHGSKIQGTVKAIYDSKTKENAPILAENQFMLTARGSKISTISGLKVGDKITLETEISATSNKSAWQTVVYAVGGHIQFAKNGKFTGQYAGDNYPSTLVGTTNDGKLILITYDGRQSSFSVGPNKKAMEALVKDLNIKNGFYVDGGGSTTMVLRDKNDGGYDVVNKPSDAGNAARTVVNSLIISCNSDAINDTTWTPGANTTAPETQPPVTTVVTTAPGTTDGVTDAPDPDNTADAPSTPADTDAPPSDTQTEGTGSNKDTGTATDPSTDAPTGDNEIKFPTGTSAPESEPGTDTAGGGNDGGNTGIIIAVCAVVVAVALGVGAVIIIKKKKS